MSFPALLRPEGRSAVAFKVDNNAVLAEEDLPETHLLRGYFLHCRSDGLALRFQIRHNIEQTVIAEDGT